MSEAGELAGRTAGSVEAGARRALRSPRPAALGAAVLFALVVAAWVPLSLLARQSPLVNGGETPAAIPFGAVGLVIAWPPRRCSPRCVTASSGRWTGGSTGPATTLTRW
jgi:hypothetical protein